MNKLLTKIVGVSLGLALATGVGVGIAMSNRDFAKTDAASATHTITVNNLDGWTGTQGSQTGSSGGFTIESDNAANSTQLRFYAGGTHTFTSTVGNMTQVVFTCTANGTANYGPGKMSGTGYTASSGKTGTWTGNAASFTLTGGQARVTSIEITYDKIEAGDPTSISCAAQTINVAGKVNLTNQTVIAPTGASTDLSFTIKSGSDYIDLDATTGIVTGKKGGSAVVTITPSNTSGGATAIDVAITVNSITAPGISEGDSYVIYCIDETNGNSELTGITSNLGTSTSFTGDVPSCSYVLEVEEGYYENTVAFKHGSSYLALTSAANNLYTNNEVNSYSSWIVTYDSSDNSATIISAAFTDRALQWNYNNGNPRFACYTTVQKAIHLYPFEDKSLTNFTIDASISVYKTGTAAIGVTYTPADASDKTLNWASSNTSIATVDANGVVTGVAVGTCNVTASKVISGSTIERTCAVTVLDNKAAHLGNSSDPFDVNDAVQAAKGVFTQTSNGTTIDLTNTYYYVKGIITKNITRTTNELSFWIGDDSSQQSAATGGFEIFKAAKVYGTDLGTYYSQNSEVQRDFNVGYTIKASGKLTLFNGTPEMNAGGYVSYNSYIEARLFAEAFNTALEAVCDADGATVAADLASAWSSQATAFAALDETTEQSILTNATAKTTSGATAVELCVAKYDYIIGKYNTTTVTTYTDFMGRVDAGKITLSSGSNLMNRFILNSDTTVLTVIVITAVLGFTTIGGYFLLRKKKEER